MLQPLQDITLKAALPDAAPRPLNTFPPLPDPSTLRTIGNRAFYNYRGGKLMLPEGLERIGDEAFYRCSVRGTLELPEGLKEIGDSAFARSIFMRTLDLPSTLEIIGEHAFEDVSLSYVYMDGLTPPQGCKNRLCRMYQPGRY